MLTILPQAHPKFIRDNYHFIFHPKKECNRHLLRCNDQNDDKMLTKSPQLTPHHLCCWCYCGLWKIV